MKSILLMFISEHSGHHQASLALEKAILEIDPGCRTLSINAFKLTNPVLEKITHKTYMGVIKNKPEIWSYLYDNPRVVKKTEGIRNIITDAGSKKLENLILSFRPDATACTQALPCSLMAHYKKRRGVKTPLVGILTDYAPHSYWIYDEVDKYVVPSVEIKDTLVKKGVPADKIEDFGTPIDPLFTKVLQKDRIYEETGLSHNKPVILVMGGTHGIGPDEKLLKELDDSREDMQIVVITGVNKRLFGKIKKFASRSGKKIVPLGFVNNVHELMEISDIIVTKPGGLTTAEALAKSLPMIILNPLPGQEDLNARVLTEKGIALKAADEKDARLLIEGLIRDPGKRKKMGGLMRKSAKPRSASQTAELLLKLAG